MDRASAVEQGSGAQALGDFMRFAGGSLGAIIFAELLEVLGVVKQVVSEVVGGPVLRRPVMAAQRVSRRRIARARRPEYAVPDSAGHRSAKGATAVAGVALRVISSCRACLRVRGCGRIWSCPSSAVRGLIADRAGARVSRRGCIAWPGVSYCYWFK